jgi:hypothetical protein
MAPRNSQQIWPDAAFDQDESAGFDGAHRRLCRKAKIHRIIERNEPRKPRCFPQEKLITRAGGNGKNDAGSGVLGAQFPGEFECD